jgi:hypothetical protein
MLNLIVHSGNATLYSTVNTLDKNHRMYVSWPLISLRKLKIVNYIRYSLFVRTVFEWALRSISVST